MPPYDVNNMRELFKKYWKPFALGFLLIASLIYYTSHLGHKESASASEERLLSFVSPLQKSVFFVTDGFSATWSNLFGPSTESATSLRSKNAELQKELVDHEELRLENERLRKLLAFSADREERMVTARVIGVDATSWFRSITIDRGSSDRLREGMAVITAHGVVGRIVTCTPHSSRVLLAVDSSSRLSILIERTRARAVSHGDGSAMSLDYLPLTDDVKVGDLIITSGLGGGFPKGLIVGEITDVDKRGFDMFQSVKVEPAVDFENIEEVLVIASSDSTPFTSSKP